jgi:hypothetical protein
MKKAFLIPAFVIFTTFAFSQTLPPSYSSLVKKADSLYKAKDFKQSALTYSNAFKANDWKATSNDRYNAACSWALAGNADSAFFHLDRIATMMNYMNYAHITSDPDLNSLHGDKRWPSLLETIKQNKEKAEANLDKPLVARLDSIYQDDQAYRKQIMEIGEKYGWESKEVKDQWTIVNAKDSVNLVKIKAILDQYGWLGTDVIGTQGNTTLFLVIQHADLATQEKYLPMMREAVKNGKAKARDLAMLEDRVALRQGKKQIYGSQVFKDPDTQKYYVLPLEDPDNVDKRRAEVGLQPLADYLAHWQMKWDVEQYKKELPALMEKEKSRAK